MKGKRVEGKKPWELEDGDFMKGEKMADGAIHWWIKPPGGEFGHISDKIHTIVEHEDGTITVSPSILYHGEKGWHGFLEKGVWRSC